MRRPKANRVSEGGEEEGFQRSQGGQWTAWLAGVAEEAGSFQLLVCTFRWLVDSPDEKQFWERLVNWMGNAVSFLGLL